MHFQVSQISCNDPNLPPSGCDQWFTGASGTGYINTFNYQGSVHLSNQKQDICVR
jgi:hypothetical protein